MSVPAAVRTAWKSLTAGNTFEKVLQRVELTSAGDGKCVAEMTVTEGDTNPGGTLHGGMTSTLMDVISGIALSTHSGGAVGVSVDLHVSFLKGAPLGEKIIIEAKTNKAGRTLAFLDIVVKNQAGNLIATGSHTKFIGF